MNVQHALAVLVAVAVACLEYCRTEQSYCQRIHISGCTHLWYNYTQMPNGKGHMSQHDVELELELLRQNMGHCSKYVNNFLCVTFLPKCLFHNDRQVQRPCRRHCKKIQMDCEGTLNGRRWPQYLSCEDLTDDRKYCISLSGPPPVQPQTVYRHSAVDSPHSGSTDDDTRTPASSASRTITSRLYPLYTVFTVCIVIMSTRLDNLISL